MIKIATLFGSGAMKETGNMIQSELDLRRKENHNITHLCHCFL